MPLLTDDPEQARKAFRLLEARAQSAEQRADVLQAALAFKPAATPGFSRLLSDRVLQLEAENATLRIQLDQLSKFTPDIALEKFVSALAMSVAIGEASMPDRAIPSISATVQSYLAPGAAGVGLRFQAPELAATDARLSTTSFEIAKVPVPPGTAAPRSFYAVLQEKQRVCTDPFLAKSLQASAIIVEVAKTLANTDSWSFNFLAQSVFTIAGLEKKLADSLKATGKDATAYGAAVDNLIALDNTLRAKTNPVVGDLLALVAALDAATSALKTLLP